MRMVWIDYSVEEIKKIRKLKVLLPTYGSEHE